MDLMTLAIAETSKDKYAIIAVDTESLRFYVVDGLGKEQIVSANNDFYWDIGAVTRITNPQIQGDKIWLKGQYCEMIKPFDRNAFKKMLKGLSAEKSDFFENKKKPFDVVRFHKVVRIWSDISSWQKKRNTTLQEVCEDATVPPPKRNHRLEAYVWAKKSSGRIVDDYGVDDPSGDYAVIELLNKDFRWVQYWDWIESTDGDKEDKRKKYMGMLNAQRFEKFFVMYRFYPKSGKEVEWIGGVHVL